MQSQANNTRTWLLTILSLLFLITIISVLYLTLQPDPVPHRITHKSADQTPIIIEAEIPSESVTTYSESEKQPIFADDDPDLINEATVEDQTTYEDQSLVEQNNYEKTEDIDHKKPEQISHQKTQDIPHEESEPEQFETPADESEKSVAIDTEPLNDEPDTLVEETVDVDEPELVTEPEAAYVLGDTNTLPANMMVTYMDDTYNFDDTGLDDKRHVAEQHPAPGQTEVTEQMEVDSTLERTNTLPANMMVSYMDDTYSFDDTGLDNNQQVAEHHPAPGQAEVTEQMVVDSTLERTNTLPANTVVSYMDDTYKFDEAGLDHNRIITEKYQDPGRAEVDSALESTNALFATMSLAMLDDKYDFDEVDNFDAVKQYEIPANLAMMNNLNITEEMETGNVYDMELAWPEMPDAPANDSTPPNSPDITPVNQAGTVSQPNSKAAQNPLDVYVPVTLIVRSEIDGRGISGKLKMEYG